MRITTDIFRLDARGLQCPLPVLKAKKALGVMAAGDKIEVLTTDAASVRDFDAFTRKHGHLLLRRSQSAGLYHFLIQKGANSACGGIATESSKNNERKLDN